MLDSGAFSEIAALGRFETSPAAYRDAVLRAQEVGHLQWAAPQDWMCEPPMLAKTGGTVAEHQARTLESVMTLLGWGLPILPVLQGWTPEEYQAHVAAYRAAGLRLDGLVGVGSVCRRQRTDRGVAIFRAIHRTGVTQLHGFGVKRTGLGAYAPLLASADSMAWSFAARREDQRPGTCAHARCNYCLPYALAWRETIMAGLGRQEEWPW